MEEAAKKADVLIEALSYIQQFAGRPVVIKFGGSAMENPAILDDVLEDVVFLAAVGVRPIVVHGGGPQISAVMKEAGLTPKFVQGHRVTDADTLGLVVRILAEEINGEIVRHIEAYAGRAQSSFANGRSLLHARKKMLTVPDRDGLPQQIDIGYVGEVVAVDAEQMLAIIADGTILAVPPIGQDESGQLYNVNADTAAAAVAAAVGAEKIVFLSNVHGIMAHPDDPDSLLSTVKEGEVQSFVEQGIISGGMLPKVAACASALDAGVRKAHIIDGRLPHSLLLEIFTDKGVGTQILKG
ncbi:MAG: acetylglutamate kinase [Candidatus Brocadiae bacterium]|nr:acetylglutamate kinase [Candidatus Brocadiia bacterium]